MRVKSIKVFVQVLVFGAFLGASSTAYADALSITSFTISNLQFNATRGTAQFTLTDTTARAGSDNSFGENVQNMSNAFPLAQASATVSFATALGITNASTSSLSGSTSAIVGGCSCSASSFVFNTFTGTLLITGAEGLVDVNISALASHLRHIQTDQFGVIAESEVLFDLFVNGSPVFAFQIDLLSPGQGPNLFTMLQGSHPLAGTIRLQSGVEHTIRAVFTTRSWAVNEVPEPATIILLGSGLGFVAGVVRKRRKDRESVT